MQKLILSALVLAGATCAQTISMPPYMSHFTAAATRGFWFQAPVAFTITGIQVYNETNNPNQVVEVIDLLGAPPPAFPATVVGTQLAYDNSTPTGTPAPMAVAITPGQYIGILCATNPTQGSATSANSYSVTPGPYNETVLGVPIVLDRFGTQSGIAANGGNQPCWQESGFSISRADVYVSSASGFATKLTFGDGCNEEYASFYENHSAFDLSNTSLNFTNAGTGYVVLPGTNAVVTPTAAPTAFGDDVVVPFPLGWTLPYPGGVTTDLYVSSNGFCHLVAQTGSGCCAFNLTMFLTMGPVFAAKWRDLNPSAGGTVTLETDPVAGTATVTFDQVPDFGSSNPNTFQYYFDSTGNVELRFGTVDPTAGGTGWSPGLANLDPGSIDISATPVILTGAVDITPLAYDGDARPVIGTTINMTATNVPTGSQIGAVVYGLTQYVPGIDLTSIGMPNCFQHCSQDSVQLIIAPTGNSFSSAFVIPNDTGLAGVIVLSQSAVYDPAGGHNALGALSSNGVELVLDIN